MLKTPNSLNDSEKHLKIYKRNLFETIQKQLCDKQNR